MTLLLSGTNGLSDVDGSAATPAIRGTDTNTGIFFPAADTIAFSEGGAEVARFDSSGNLGLGVTPSAWSTASSIRAIEFLSGSLYNFSSTALELAQNSYISSGQYIYKNTSTASRYTQAVGSHQWFTAPSGTAGNAITFTEKARIDSDGLKFNGDTAAANALDDYEEGTFTPVVIGATTAGTGTYTDQSGVYTKIGNRVFYRINLSWTAHTGTGVIIFTGLPFTSAVGDGSPQTIHASNLTFSNTLAASVRNNNTQVYVQTFSSGTTLTGVPMDTAATISVSGHYQVV